jgi:hypothetical protein
MEFYPSDTVIPAGDELVLRIAADNGVDPCTAANNQSVEDTVQGQCLPGAEPGSSSCAGAVARARWSCPSSTATWAMAPMRDSRTDRPRNSRNQGNLLP